MSRSFFIIALLLLSACANEPKINTVAAGNDGKAVVIPPQKCPNWTGQRTNYSCANHHNYGQMIVEPEDMIIGRSTDNYDSTNTARKVTTYRLGGGGGEGTGE